MWTTMIDSVELPSVLEHYNLLAESIHGIVDVDLDGLRRVGARDKEGFAGRGEGVAAREGETVGQRGAV